VDRRRLPEVGEDGLDGDDLLVETNRAWSDHGRRS